MDWQHGYHADGAYTCGFYRELAPAWLDFASLLRGHRSPRRHAGEPFRYLELGSGMGLCLCLLAATYPEGQFIGVDFQPDHILHSRRLSEALQLSNIQFIEDDFLRLSKDSSALGGQYHYVVAHGIAAWVAQPIRQALLKVAADSLIPGGLFYCSYNTMPGWLATFPLQQLACLEYGRRAPGTTGAAQAVQGAAATLQSLLGTTENPSALAIALPGLRDRLAILKEMDSSYLVQEFINGGWQPLTVQDFHASVMANKLQYAASAALPDNFPGLLPANVRDTVMAESDTLVREALQDLAINKSFRRDIFIRGVDTLLGAELTTALHTVHFCLQEAPERESYPFTTSFGLVNGNSNLCRTAETLLADGPASFSVLQDRLSLSMPDLAQVLSLLLHSGRVAIDRGEAGQAATSACSSVNRTLSRLQLTGRPYHFRAAAPIGSAVAFSIEEALLETAAENNGGSDHGEALINGIDALGRTLDGTPELVMEAYQQRRHRLQRLGIGTC